MSVHLSIRSHYSLLNGLMSIDDILLNAKQRGFNTVGITEHRVMFSALEFFIKAQKHNIKPLFGLEIKIDDYHSLLMAKNNRGFQFLQRMSFDLSTEASLSLSDIKNFQEDLIFIIYSEGGPFEEDLLQENYNNIYLKMSAFKNEFTHFYIGISHQESNFFRIRNEKLIEVAKELSIQSCALPKVYYKDPEDVNYHKALLAIQHQTLLNDPNLPFETGRYLLNKEEYETLYAQELRDVSNEIAKMCHVDLFELKTSLPEFKNEYQMDNDEFLSQLSRAGLNKRLNNKVPLEYKDRLEYELDVIISMGFTNYFLIVYDVIRYAKLKGIQVGPGRGSSAGSLVAYCLGITEVDSIKYGLLFERFLNPERTSMPDIDIDFPDDKRDQVINYAIETYGSQHLAHIIAFGTLRGKQSFRDSCRILNVPLNKVDSISKLISDNGLVHSIEKNNRLYALVHADEQIKEAYDLAMQLEGTPRHTTQHAAGIVFSKKPLLEVVPLIRLDHTTLAIQYDMTYLEQLGLIKIDFLGIRNLALIDRIASRIRVNDPSFSISNIPYDNQKTYQLLAQAETTGIFQLESDGMKDLLRKMRPKRFLDIVDAIALYRPGPMENIPTYLKHRQNPSHIKYLHEDLKEITQDTFGILIYQEQIMQVAQKFASFTFSKADILRTAMSKKDEKILGSLEEDFTTGALNNGYDSQSIKEIFSLIYKFANYGFNKSHSVSYAMVAYQLAYLKANYASYFFTELLNSVIGSDRKTKQYIDESKSLNVLLLSPNLDQSSPQYEYLSGKIRFPLTIIKGISRKISENIVSERDVNGPYQSYYNAIVRLVALGLNEGQLHALIDGGALDYFGYNRTSMTLALPGAIQYAGLVKVQDALGNVKFDFDLVSEPIFTSVKENKKEILRKELNVLGFYLSDHPALELRQKHHTDSIINCNISQKQYRVIAQIESIKEHRTKTGKMMAFLLISDDSGNMDAILFPNVFEKVEGKLELNQLLLLKGRVREEQKLIVDDIFIFV